MDEKYRYIVYVANVDTDYYDSWYSQKESNQIEDILAIFKSEEKAKDMCKGREDLDYKQIIWEE